METVPYTPEAPTVATAIANPDDHEIRLSTYVPVLVNKFNDAIERILSDEDVEKILAAWKPYRAANELDELVLENTDMEFSDPIRAVAMHLAITSSGIIQAVIRLREYSSVRSKMFRCYGYNLVECVDGSLKIGLADARDLVVFARLAAGISKETK